MWSANGDQRLLVYLEKAIDVGGSNTELRILGNAGLVSVDPENIKAVLSKSKIREGELDWGYGERRLALLPLFGEGLFTQDGLPWKHSRELLRKQFARIQYHNLDVFTNHVELLISRISRSEDTILDLHPLFLNFTLDTSTSLLFGESAGSLHETSNDEFGRNLNEASWYSCIRVQLAYLYWVCSPPKYHKACRKVREYADDWVKKAVDEETTTETKSDRYLFINSLFDELKDRRLVRDQLVNVLLAGRDTTASLLSWTFRLLVRHPDVLTRLKQEVQSVMGDDQTVTKATLQKLPYLKCIVTETLRLYPLVPINIREAKWATVLPRGGGSDGQSPLLVRKDMGIGYSPYFMHRRTDLYGEDARSFKPERWEDGTLQERIGWAYLPFNGGPRICLGQEFALLEASYAIARIVQSFPNIRLPAGEDIEPIGTERQSLTLTLAPAAGCKVTLH
ncbi:MAG: hypothetical protein M1828_001665 [Chrysothrix sp. TS-e1954]|nr:MAG: hypothetical protein M1828_001665 [Chrysothrix sp. TS-e1954]